MPRVSKNATLSNLVGEVFPLIAVGTILFAILFIFTIFFRKVPGNLTYSVALASLFFASYFCFSVGGLLGFTISYVNSHCYLALCLTLGFVCYFHALKIYGFFHGDFTLFFQSIFFSKIKELI